VGMGGLSRGMAFCTVTIILCGTAIGSVLPESGNFISVMLKMPVHSFNPYFLSLGIIGIMLACYFGYRRSR